MLYDRNFLLQLDQQKNKTTYAKITSLSFDEIPIESIEGRVSQGTINIDGKSAVRRTCSLTVLLDSFNYSSYNWSLETKFKLEIGVQNDIDSNYPDIIWFNQGLYLITGFTVARSTNNFTLSINGKDKMCLLNGDLGGHIEALTDFGQLEEESADGTITITKLTIPEILKNLLYNYAKESPQNIIIKDLEKVNSDGSFSPLKGYELLEYRYDVPMYLYRRSNSKLYENALIEAKDIKIYKKNSSNRTEMQLINLTEDDCELLVGGLLTATEINSSTTPTFYLDNNATNTTEYVFSKMSYGQTVGYRETDLTYPGELVANPNETITSVLDKIKNVLVNFEYFYDVDGKFIFQKKKTFLQTSNTNGTDLALSILERQESIGYVFEESPLIISLNTNPNLTNVKNDFSIWGERESVSGAKIPIHLRFAIDKKPEKYKAYNGNTYQKSISYKVSGTTIECDWREIIYQMSKDYFAHFQDSDFEQTIISNNTFSGVSLYPSGKTGYEKYYSDIFSFWRDIYDPEIVSRVSDYINAANAISNQIITVQNSLKTEKNYSTILTYREREKELKNQNIKLLGWPLESGSLLDSNLKSAQESFYSLLTAVEKETYGKQYSAGLVGLCENAIVKRNSMNIDSTAESSFSWLKDVFYVPENLTFWFDFLDTSGELSKIQVRQIGQRTKTVKDTSIKSMYNRDTPNILFVDETPSTMDTGYTYITVSNMDEMFSVSSQGKSCQEALLELLNKHCSFIESINLTTLPIYNIQPNTIIQIKDKETNLSEEYTIEKMTINLSYNGNLSITGSKISQDYFI